MQKEQAAAGIEPTPLSYDSTTSANFFVVLADVMLGDNGHCCWILDWSDGLTPTTGKKAHRF